MKLIDFKSLGPLKGINYSRDHLRRKCKAGEFPEPISISSHRIAWFEEDLDRWLADKAQQSANGKRLVPLLNTGKESGHRPSTIGLRGALRERNLRRRARSIQGTGRQT